MKETLFLLGNLLAHPIQTVKGTALLTYRKAPFYVLGFVFAYLYMCLTIFLNHGPKEAYVYSLFVAAIVLWVMAMLPPLYYFIFLKLAKAAVTYRTARRLYLPCIILNLLFSTVYSMFGFWIPALTAIPIFGLFVTLWYAAITFLLCKYKFSLPERRCWIVFSVILLLKITWLIISSLLP